MRTFCAPTGVRTGYLSSTSEEGYCLNQAARSLHIILQASFNKQLFSKIKAALTNTHFVNDCTRWKSMNRLIHSPPHISMTHQEWLQTAVSVFAFREQRACYKAQQRKWTVLLSCLWITNHKKCTNIHEIPNYCCMLRSKYTNVKEWNLCTYLL